MGRWNRIAQIPLPEDGDPSRCLHFSVLYTLLNSGLKMNGTCYDLNWVRISTSISIAVPKNYCVPAALIVDFTTAKSTIVNYLVHKTDYDTFSLVGSPDRTYLLILSRKRMMKWEVYLQLKKFAHKLGYDISKLRVDYNSIKNKKCGTCRSDIYDNKSNSYTCKCIS